MFDLNEQRFISLEIYFDVTPRAGLNEREAPGKIVTARPPKRLAQLRSLSYALGSTLQKHRSKTAKLIRFGSLHFKDNWE